MSETTRAVLRQTEWKDGDMNEQKDCYDIVIKRDRYQLTASDNVCNIILSQRNKSFVAIDGVKKL